MPIFRSKIIVFANQRTLVGRRLRRNRRLTCAQFSRQRIGGRRKHVMSRPVRLRTSHKNQLTLKHRNAENHLRNKPPAQRKRQTYSPPRHREYFRGKRTTKPMKTQQFQASH